MGQERRGERRRAAAIRQGDHGSYTALRWVSILFRSAAIFLTVAVFAECIAGIRAEGWEILPFLLGELARAIVISVLLWAGGDLIRLLVQYGRDLRAERLLLARIADRTPDLRPRSDQLLARIEERERRAAATQNDHGSALEGGPGSGDHLQLDWDRGLEPE